MASLEDLSVDQLLAHAKQQDALIATVLKDPQAREMAQRALKKVNPNLSIPELDVKEHLKEALKPLEEKNAKLEADALQRDIKERAEKKKKDAIEKYKLSDADVLEVEKLIVDPENPIPNYDAAARVYRASQQSAVPTSSSLSPPTFSMPENDVWGKGIGNKAALDKIAMNEAYAALNDLRSGKVAGLGPAVTN